MRRSYQLSCIAALCLCRDINGEKLGHSDFTANSPSNNQYSKIFEFISSLKGAVTPSLLLIVAYLILNQYLPSLILSFRSNRSSNPNRELMRRSKKVKNGAAVIKKNESIISVTDVSTQSSSAGTQSSTPKPGKSLNVSHSNLPLPHNNMAHNDVLSHNNETPQAEIVEPKKSVDLTPRSAFKRTPKGTDKKKKFRILSGEKKQDVQTIAEEILIKDQWLAFIDSKDATFVEILTQLESGRSVLLNGIKEFVHTGNDNRMTSIVDLILELHRSVEAAGLSYDSNNNDLNNNDSNNND